MPTYDRPTEGYTQKIPPGTAALRRYIGDHWGLRTEVIRDRSRCQQQNSEHCVCRGIDAYTTDPIVGRAIFDWCVTNAERLGIQSVIWQDREWGFGDWRERHRAKRDHFDHVHVGVNRWGAHNISHAHLRGQDDQGGFLMALTDEQQQYLYDVIVNELYGGANPNKDGLAERVDRKLDDISRRLAQVEHRVGARGGDGD